MYRVAIVDDDRDQCQQLRDFSSQYFHKMSQEVELHCFQCGEDFLGFSPAGFDIVLLDIKMKGLNGIDIAQELRRFNERMIIIFITNMPQYALEGYRVKALDYVLKPISYTDLQERYHNALQILQRDRPAALLVKSSGGLLRIIIRDITYIEAANKKTVIYAADRAIVCYDTLQALEKKLAAYGFFRCHHGFLINMNYVESLNESSTVVAMKTIPVSKHRRKEYLKELTDYIGCRL